MYFDEIGFDTQATSVSVVVSPAVASVAAGGTQQFTATVTGSTDTAATWSMQEVTGCGSVSSTGLYTAPAAAATCHLIATSHADSTQSATATMTVTATPPVVAISMSPAAASLVAIGTQQFTATVTGSTDTAATWTTQEASGCGSVSSAGLYTAPAAAATCHVVATSHADSTKKATATVTVTATPPVVAISVTPATASLVAGGTQQFTATVTGSTDTAATWTMQEASGCGSVSSAGLYTPPAAAATCHVVATSHADSTKKATATVAVTAAPPVVAISVTPATASLVAGGTQQFTATVTGSTDTATTWTMQEASGCGSVSSTGLYTAPAAAATCHVVATSHADSTKKATATLTVTAAPPVVAISVTPATASLVAGGTQQFTATVTGSTDTAATWSMQEVTGCGSVSSTGLYTAPAVAATCHVVATSHADSTKKATATLTVTAAPPVVAISVTPATASLVAGGTQQFTATVTGSTDTATTWTMQEASGCGSVSSTGLYTAPAVAATCHVVATSHADSTKKATTTVTVTAAPPVVAISVTPATASLVAGGTQQFTATVTGSTDTAATWTMQEASGCGSVSSTGLYTAPAVAATCHVVATSHADSTKKATTTVAVTAAPPVVAISVTPATAAVLACQSLALTATVTGFANTAATWTVQEGSAGGSVTALGVYTAPSTAGTYHVVATSSADSTKSATTTLTVSTQVLSVAVSPQNLSIPSGGSAQFTATVTTTCGQYTATQTVSAP